MIELRLLGGVGVERASDASARKSAHARQPKRMAALVYLALAPAGAARRRDTILAYFWPELDDARARAALRQLLHLLRRTLGPDPIVASADGDVALASATVWCDAVELEKAAAEQRHADVLDLYR